MSIPSQVTQPAIHVRGLEKSFDELTVLRGVDLDVARGSIFALLGSNGAGKTTIVRIRGRGAADRVGRGRGAAGRRRRRGVPVAAVEPGVTGYRLSVTGPVSRPLLETIAHRFGDVAVGRGGRDTLLDADLPDQPSLRALLTLLWDAGHDVVALSPAGRRTAAAGVCRPHPPALGSAAPAGPHDLEAGGALMTLTTPLCELLGIDLPIVQAPIGSSSTPELAAAVSEAGGLGTLAQTWFDVPVVRERLRRVRSLTARPVGVNLVLDLPVQDQLEACLEEGAGIVSTFWGDPGPVHDAIRSAGALHVHTVGSVADAVLAAERGVDVLVAQGWESGGHVHGTIGTMALVPAVVDAVAPLPVIAAGGIADGRGIVAALALGAQAVWLGTRFVTADEAKVHDVYRQRVLDASADDSVHGLAYDGGWPGAPGRTLRNATLTAWEAAGRPAAPNRPGEGDIIARDRSGRGYERYNDLMPLPGMTGDLEEMALYAGQSVGLVRAGGPARDIVARLAQEASEELDQLHRRLSS
jgi:NAD(P)H-dependent flavin oxidoreductase YrpB (nitropropane dioxygenase family)